MAWKTIDTQEELDALNQAICWEDATTVQYIARFENETYFPDDVCRTGYLNKNVHLWIDALNVQDGYLRLVLIDCDWIGPQKLDSFHLSGKMDSLMRITINDCDGSTAIRFSRLIYRFEPDVPVIRLDDGDNGHDRITK